jgi:coproporphyrinogen III oxidase
VLCRAAAPATAAPAQVDAAAFEEFLLEAQQQILSDAEQLDGSGQKFVEDRWERPGDNAGKCSICSTSHVACMD